MRRPSDTPSLVPAFDLTVHLVLDDFGDLGRAYRETDEERTDLETVIEDLIRGEYNHPLRVVAFNTAEGWSRDVTEDVDIFGRPRSTNALVASLSGQPSASARANQRKNVLFPPSRENKYAELPIL